MQKFRKGGGAEPTILERGKRGRDGGHLHDGRLRTYLELARFHHEGC